jgi:hypothetical protein
MIKSMGNESKRLGLGIKKKERQQAKHRRRRQDKKPALTNELTPLGSTPPHQRMELQELPPCVARRQLGKQNQCEWYNCTRKCYNPKPYKFAPLTTMTTTTKKEYMRALQLPGGEGRFQFSESTEACLVRRVLAQDCAHQ